MQPPPFQKNWLMAPSTTIGPGTSCMREDLFWGLVWVSKVVVLVCTLVSLCPVTSVGVLFRSINSVLLLRGFGVRHCCYLLRGARRVAFHGGFVVGVFYDCVDWSFLLARVPALLGVQGKFGEAFNVFARLRDLGTDTARSSLCRWSRLLRQKESCVSRRTRARCGLSWSPSPETAVPWCMVL